jgi:hypothetical protein
LHLSGIHQNHLSFVYDTPLLFFDSISVLYHAGALPDNVIQQNHHCSNHCVPIYAVSKPSAYRSFEGLSSFVKVSHIFKMIL